MTVDKEFVCMWQMWLVCFIKNKHRPHLTKVKSSKIAKGLGKMIGNKGGVSQSFMLYNRMFSFVAVHLKHGQNKVKERNEMSGELIKQMQLHQV